MKTGTCLPSDGTEIGMVINDLCIKSGHGKGHSQSMFATATKRPAGIVLALCIHVLCFVL